MSNTQLIERRPHVNLSASIYSVLHWLWMPGIILRLAWRARGNPAYLQDISQRFGFGDVLPSARPRVWLHAVSVGEAQAAIPLIRNFQERYPHYQILVTTTTPTGRDRIRNILGDTVELCYMPYDVPSALKRFIRRVRPKFILIMETELWPNLFALCARYRIPIYLINARLSERSANGYRRFSAVTQRMLNQVTGIAAQSQSDATRLLSLGANPDRLHVTGSIKFDMQHPASLREQAEVLRRYWGTDRSVLIAASTHEGEDARFLDAYGDIKKMIPSCLLVLVPRHPERFTAVAGLCQRRGMSMAMRSEVNENIQNADIFIGDSMGELPLFYAASDVAFVGGSLVEIGGHNMLEPAALGLPVLFGPHVFNFSRISRLLLDCGAARQIMDQDQLIEAAIELLSDANLRQSMGDLGRQVVEQNRGAIEEVMQMLESSALQSNH